ncbi:hypothetical protein MFIFM68171_08143 [Madurella fahalii]|uniref:Uncharacterized protein n=1 Tax=Madurella fahalii TaxID=1157608 RepID=A0ABQ0GJI5_9PEZI
MTDERAVRARPILACLKRVYGAAFSGYPQPAQPREDAVVQRLMQLGNSYMSLPRGKPAIERRSRLRQLAKDLQSSLMMCLGGEVDKHLSRIVNISLWRKDRGEWSILTNDSQLLVNLLLSGDDFEHVILLPPEDFNEESFRWPRYLISFGNHIEGFDYDIIEYIGRCAGSPSESHSKALTRLCQFSPTDLSSQALLNKLWLLPGDSLSLLQFHLLRPPHEYHLKDKDWMENRLCVMQLLNVMATFTGALGNALYHRLLAGGRRLLSRITIPPARVLGNIRPDERLHILDKLGPRLTVYDIVNRTPNAMRPVVENPLRFWTRPGPKMIQSTGRRSCRGLLDGASPPSRLSARLWEQQLGAVSDFMRISGSQ